MKRLMSALLLACMLLSLCACGSESKPESSAPITESTAPTTSDSPSSTGATATDEFALTDSVTIDTEESTNTDSGSVTINTEEKTDDYTSTWEFVEHTDGGVMRDSMTALNFRDEMGLGWNLGNTFEAYWSSDENKTGGAQEIGMNSPYSYEMCWGAPVTTKAAIDGIRDAGFSTVRIPVYWGNMMEDDGKFKIKKEYIDRVCQIINYCREDGLYVVVNIHHYDGFLIEHYSEEEVLSAMGILWTQIAKALRDYSDYVIFEGYNEAVGSLREEDKASYQKEDIYRYVNALNQVFVDSVRATGGNNANRMLIASGYWTNIDNTTNALYQLPKDSANDRLMVSVHYVDNVPYWSNKIGTEYWRDYSIKQCEELKEAFTDNGIVVFVGECTTTYGEKQMANATLFSTGPECMEWEISLILDYGFIPVYWDTAESFYSRKNCQIIDPANQAVVQRLLEKISK